MSSKVTADELRALKRFPLVARKYCELIELRRDHAPKTVANNLYIHLAGLCEVAALLPQVETSKTIEEISINRKEIMAKVREWKRLRNSLQHFLGTFDAYWLMFGPTKTEEPISASLSNDIADIYIDLKSTLKMLAGDESISAIHWQWRFDFRVHCGRHAVSALTALHHIVAWDHED